ncbi:hypothetical protein ACSFA3_17360 [Variovorax sp. RHLX14]|uniref:hypothetical protein n=1 Tax=Variovorax sp. RHLX14 TaxID=1259731 RepID=UPI003F48C8D3
MSIPSIRPAAKSSQPVVREITDGKANAQVAPFAREKPISGTEGPARTGRARSVEPTPFKPLARALCAAGADHHARLVERGVGNPTYLGSDKGGWTYFNKANGELGICNLHLGHGILGLGDYGTTCIVKKDGRIIFNGETLTMNHPEAQNILAALDALLQKIASDDLPRGSIIGGNTLPPPWHPASIHFPEYVD